MARLIAMSGTFDVAFANDTDADRHWHPELPDCSNWTSPLASGIHDVIEVLKQFFNRHDRLAFPTEQVTIAKVKPESRSRT